MADVSRDRGQLILITALLIAVTMVSLVMLLNTAIFTENQASRGLDQSGREALEYRAVVLEAVDRLVAEEHAREPTSWSALHDDAEAGISAIDEYTARNYASRTAIAGINGSSLSLVEGRRVRQNNSTRAFTDDTGTADWDVATAVEGTRNYTMTVDRSDLNTTTAADAYDSGAFRVRVDEDGDADYWVAYVYADDVSGNVTLATNVSGTGTTEHCSVSAAEASIDLSAGTIAGADCAGYDWAEGVSTPYTVRYEHGENATGTYNLTVDVTDTSSFANLNDGGPDSPFHFAAIYRVSFDVYFETHSLHYRAPVRLAPGEPA